MDEALKKGISEKIKFYQEQRAKAAKAVDQFDGAISALIELLENDAKEEAPHDTPVPAN